MKKLTNLFLKIMPIVVVVTIVVGSVYGIAVTDPTGTAANADVTAVANKIWGTIIAIVQILAIAAIVIAGVRYMFAGAENKADIKKQTITLVVGAVLVFAAFPIAQFIQKVAVGIF
jgi:succinate dehydrogenase/fumarate reductase cytochrome b subunit